MAISFGGINTGLPPNLVDQLVDAEKIPIRNAELKKTKIQAKSKLVDELDTKLRAVTGSLGELAGTRGFTDIKLNSGDANIVQGTVDPGTSVNGSWNVEVVELASKAAAVSNGFPDKNSTEIGVGYFKFKTPEGSKDVYISGGNNTLEGAAKAINSANLGVRASVINDKKDPDAPFRLIITGTSLGDENQVDYPTLYFLDGDQDIYFDEERPAKNGKVKIDGYEMEISDNQLKDFIPGVTLDLKQAAPGRTVNISVKEDYQLVVGKIKKFVESINGVLGFIQSQNSLNQKSDTTSTLGGDSILRTVENDLRRILQNPQFGVNGSITRLAQLGVEFNRNGTLDYKEEKFTATLAANAEDVQKFFVGNNFDVGLIPQIKRTISNMTDGAFGIVSNRKRGLSNAITQADKRIEDMERRITAKERTLRQQFSNLEEKMSRLKQQGAMIAQRMGGGDGGGGFNLGGMSGG
jgi:flagellar hook-associated protein 2